MTEIIINSLETNYLVKKLREIFNPIIISEKNETLLNFDNDLGHGTFSIYTLGSDRLNIYFKGTFKSTLDIKFYNTEQPALNFLYLQNGEIKVKHGEEETLLKNGETQQLIYGSKVKEDEIMHWPKDVEIEFNLIKTFINNRDTNEGLFSVKHIESFADVRATRSNEIISQMPLLHSGLVGDERMKDLESKIDILYKAQLKELD